MERLFDLSMKQTDGPFGIRYRGYLDLPRDGVYTFHPPAELYDIDKDAGYDLRVFIDGQEWFPAPRNHARHRWSVSLAKGLHRFLVIFTDFRRASPKEEYRWGFPRPGATWDGVTPDLRISGPGLDRQPIPSEWLWR